MLFYIFLILAFGYAILTVGCLLYVLGVPPWLAAVVMFMMAVRIITMFS
jgi:hypothetical protein